MNDDSIAFYRQLVLDKKPPVGWLTWDDKKMCCNHCCNGDRCDDAAHMDRNCCPYCLSTGVALWHPLFRDYLISATGANALRGDSNGK